MHSTLPKLQRHLAPLGLLAALILAAYFASLGGEFVWDDRPLIVENRWVQQPDEILRLLTSSFWETGDRHDRFRSFFRPLTSSSFAIDHALWGLRPFGFHVTNLLVHFACCCLVYAVARNEGLGKWFATAGATLFAVHPVHVESVAWISGRTDLLCTLFVLIAFLLYRRHAQGRGGSRIAACLSFALALLAKEMAAVLPLLVALDRWLTSSSDRRRRVADALHAAWPFAAVLVAYLLSRNVIVGASAEPLYSLGPIPWIATALFVVGRYVTLLLLPLGLDAHYPYEPLATPLAPTALLGGAIVVVSLFGVAYLATRNRRAAFWALWTFVGVAPVMLFGRFGDVVMADRFLYLPSVGAALLASMGFSWLLEQRWRSERVWAYGSLTLVLLTLTIEAHRRSLVWRDDFTLFSTMAQTSPGSALVRANLGLAHYKNGDMEGAASEYRRAIELTPGYSMAHNNLAAVLEQQGRHHEALRHYLITLEIAPRSVEATLNAGHLLTRLGETPRGLEMLRQVVRDNPKRVEALYALAEALDRAGRNRAALPYLESAVGIDPGYPNPYYLLGKIHAEQGRHAEAAQAMQAFLRLWQEEDRFTRRAREILHESASWEAETPGI